MGHRIAILVSVLALGIVTYLHPSSIALSPRVRSTGGQSADIVPTSALAPFPSVQTPPATLPPVPDEYRALYDALQGSINTYESQINSLWDGTKYPVNYSTELIRADVNGGTHILQSDLSGVKDELDAIQSLGIKTVTVEIGFPAFDQSFYRFIGRSTDLAQPFLNYYVTLAQEIHRRHMKMMVEANPMLTSGGTGANDLNAVPYYQSLTYQEYVSRRSAGNVIIAQQIKPDYLILQSEPSTDAVNSSRRELLNPITDAQMIRQFVADLDDAGIPGLHTAIKLGAGTGTWQENWHDYVSGFVGIAGLDSVDCHVYFIGPQSEEINTAMQIADLAHAAGKGASLAEFWPHKSVNSANSLLTGTGSENIFDIRARDTFSFWSPLDQQFIRMMMKLANYKHFDYLSPFHDDFFWSYLDYNAAPCTLTPKDQVCDSQIQAAANKAAGRALASHQISPTGSAYTSYVTDFTDQSSSAAPPLLSIDCTRGSLQCPDFIVQGDDPGRPPVTFRGYADPSMRKDLTSQRLWVAYSWPRQVDLSGGNGSIKVNTVSTHLAHSDDGGSSWVYDMALWPAVAAVDPAGSRQMGFLSSEGPSLIPVPDGGSVTWYSVRLVYFLKPIAGYHPDAKSFTLRVAQASTVQGLSTAQEQVLGTQLTPAAYRIGVNLNSLDPSLAGCTFWNDPAIFYDTGKLYLAAECLVYTAGGLPDDTQEKVAVFSASPQNGVSALAWRYIGLLADHKTALELGDQELMQVDLVRGIDGTLLTLLTPSHSDASGTQIHLGCRVIEVASLDPPVLARRNGSLVVRASVIGSDLPMGSGSCGYDPASSTGILFARRPDGVNAFTIQRSGLKP